LGRENLFHGKGEVLSHEAFLGDLFVPPFFEGQFGQGRLDEGHQRVDRDHPFGIGRLSFQAVKQHPGKGSMPLEALQDQLAFAAGHQGMTPHGPGQTVRNSRAILGRGDLLPRGDPYASMDVRSMSTNTTRLIYPVKLHGTSALLLESSMRAECLGKVRVPANPQSVQSSLVRNASLINQSSSIRYICQ
jgi:hypothetical protein